MANYNYKIKLHNIKAFVFDVDGVLTDGQVISMPNGELVRSFGSKDGFALRLCKQYNYPIGVITGGKSDSVLNRCKALLINEYNIYQSAHNKLPLFLEFCKRNGLEPEEVAYLGDDLPDIAVLKAAGLAVCPADAAEEVKNICHYISPKMGGQGCVRDIVEQVLKVQGNWVFDPISYSEIWGN